MDLSGKCSILETSIFIDESNLVAAIVHVSTLVRNPSSFPASQVEEGKGWPKTPSSARCGGNGYVYVYFSSGYWSDGDFPHISSRVRLIALATTNTRTHWTRTRALKTDGKQRPQKLDQILPILPQDLL